jgi:hypothetical protein
VRIGKENAMKKKNKRIRGRIGMWGLAVSLILLMVGSHAQAEQSIDMMSCGSGTTIPVVANEEITILSLEHKGINIDNLEKKLFDNMTYHTVGLITITNGKTVATMYSKYLEPNGDFFVVEILQSGMERDWKFIYGTGKWKGVSGGGKGYPFTKGKPVTPGTLQGCTKITGSYELLKK